jgi:hypothetical protein
MFVSRSETGVIALLRFYVERFLERWFPVRPQTFVEELRASGWVRVGRKVN